MISMINNADDQEVLKKLSDTNMETNELAANLFQCCNNSSPLMRNDVYIGLFLGKRLVRYNIFHCHDKETLTFRYNNGNLKKSSTEWHFLEKRKQSLFLCFLPYINIAQQSDIFKKKESSHYSYASDLRSGLSLIQQFELDWLSIKYPKEIILT